MSDKEHDGLTPRQREAKLNKQASAAMRSMMRSCPICNGTGKVNPPNKDTKHVFEMVDNSVMAKLLREAGYSLREIGKFLGYTSPRSIQLLLKKHGLK